MIEIMVVVVIVAILAAIALPIYLKYVQSLMRLKRDGYVKCSKCRKNVLPNKRNLASDVEELERSGHLDVSRSTKMKWSFDVQLSDQGGRITATSTEEMSYGAGHQVVYDADMGKFTGYGSSEEEQTQLEINKLLEYSIESASDLHLSVALFQWCVLMVL